MVASRRSYAARIMARARNLQEERLDGLRKILDPSVVKGQEQQIDSFLFPAGFVPNPLPGWREPNEDALRLAMRTILQAVGCVRTTAAAWGTTVMYTEYPSLPRYPWSSAMTPTLPLYSQRRR